MEYRKLGRSGLKVSIVGLGCNDFGGRWDLAHSHEVIAHALDAGVNLFDTSDVYPSPAGGEGPPGRSEEYVGEALRGRRHEAIIATKFSRPTGEGAEVYRASVLERAGHDAGETAKVAPRLLRQGRFAAAHHPRPGRLAAAARHGLHRPLPVARAGPDDAARRALRALDDLVRDGKVRYIGCSNFEGWRVAEAAGIAEAANLTPFISTQAEYTCSTGASSRPRASLPRGGRERAALLPARERLPDRQVPPRRGRAPRARASRCRRTCRAASSPTPPGTGSNASRRSRARAATRWSIWRSAGSPRSRTSAASSRARAGASRSTRTSRPGLAPRRRRTRGDRRDHTRLRLG